MATYGEPNYKFPTLARSVPNITTGGTIMATVDFRLEAELEELRATIDGRPFYPRPAIVSHLLVKHDALIRRVERLEKAARNAGHEAGNDDRCQLCRALKEEPDSVAKS